MFREHNIIARRWIQDLIRSGQISVTTSGHNFVVSPGYAATSPVSLPVYGNASGSQLSGSSGSSSISQYLPWILLIIGILIVVFAYMGRRRK